MLQPAGFCARSARRRGAEAPLHRRGGAHRRREDGADARAGEALRRAAVLEIVEENPFLASFYQDRNKYAFQTQLFFLLSRFKQQQELFQQDLSARSRSATTCSPRTGSSPRLTLDPNELALYERVFEALGPRVTKPDLVIYLQARLDVLLAASASGAASSSASSTPSTWRSCRAPTTISSSTTTETPLLVVNTSRHRLRGERGGPRGADPRRRVHPRGDAPLPAARDQGVSSQPPCPVATAANRRAGRVRPVPTGTPAAG